MEVKKATSIRSMKYEGFKNNDYLEDMVRRLNMDGAGIVLGTVDELINWAVATLCGVLLSVPVVAPSNSWHWEQPAMTWPVSDLK